MNRLSEFEHQDLSNTVWSFSTLSFLVMPLLAAIATWALNKIPEFLAQDLSNTAWAYATLNV